MPSHIMDQRHLSSLFMPSGPSSFLTEEVCLSSELGFRKAENVQDQTGLQGMPLMSGSKSVSSSPLEKLYPVGGNYISHSELPRTFLFMGQKERIFAGNHMLGTESTLNLSMTCLEASNQDILPQTNLFKQPAVNGLHFQNSLFSGSLSEAFGKKVGLMSSDHHFSKSVDETDTELNEDEPLESSKEVEAQTIGDLLPNDDDLLSGVIDDIEFVVQTNSGDEDDLFYSGGGMELESDESFNCKRACGFISSGALNSQIEDMKNKFPNELMYGKHPSRTLILRNIDSKIDGAELKILFEQFGDIRALYMASKHQGFVLVSYYDIRASNNAMSALQSRLLKQRKIDIHYYFLKDYASDKNVSHATLIVSNLDSSVTNDDMHQIFSSYGEIKEIFYDPQCQNQRAIEFYDIRAAEAALCALNMSDIAGRRIKAEPGCPGVGWRCLGKLLPLELGKEGSIICRNGDSSNIPLLEIGDFGISVNECCPINGHQYVLNNANANFHQPPGSLTWQNSLSFLNNIPAPSPQLHGLPRGPSHMLNTFIPLNHYHVGSAPALNSSIWERCSTYAGDCMEATSFHPGSFGNMGFCGSPQLHSLGIASHSISPIAGLNCMDPSISLARVGSPSSQQRSHMLHGRNRMSSLPASYDAPGERIRTRQSDAGANQTDNKKQFELDIDRIISGEDSRTTLMIKNIPNKYTSKMLLATIDEHHKGTYDFIYLPIDFKNKCNVGYAFINLTEPKNIIPFHQAFNGKKWEKFNSEKVASLAYARIQGKSALIAHFQNSSLMNEDKRCRPILFHSDGPNAGDQEPFPVGTHIRSRPGRSRTTNNEDHHQRSPSDSGNGDDLSNSTYSSSSSIKDTETHFFL